MQALKERVNDLEDVLRDFITHTELMYKRSEREMKEFKSEMSAFKDEMSVFKDEMSVFKNEMNAFKEEMKEFKDRVDKSIEESKQDRKEMNKQWGALANKMGTLIEDIVSPASIPVVKQYFGCEILDKTIRALRKRDGEYYEIDIILADTDRVFMIEVRSKPKVEYVQEILDKISEFNKFFPEYKDRKIIPIFASLTFDDNVINYATKKNLYLMAYREWEYMDIINFDRIERRS